MPVFLNKMPDRRFKLVVHVDAERHCFDGLDADLVQDDFPEFVAHAELDAPKEVAFLVPRANTLEEFRDNIESLSAVAERSGIAIEDVLVVCDCYSYKYAGDRACGPPGSVFERNWAALQQSSFSYSVWDQDQCPQAHSAAGTMLAHAFG